MGEEIDYGERYEWVRQIGSGNYGKVELCRDLETGELVAVKYLARGDEIDKNVQREVLNHQLLSGHKNIVTFKEAFLTSTHLGIAMEYAPGGTLFERIQKLAQSRQDPQAAARASPSRQPVNPEEIARYFFQQLVCGMAWMHSKGVCHRDVKLENTLLDGRATPRLLLCDFGTSKDTTISAPGSMVGTPAYIAPEVFSGDKYDGEKADVWSCGVALYTMLAVAYPFQDPEHPQNNMRTIQRILKVQYELPQDIPLSAACIDLLRRIFVADPQQRISLDEIREHPWFLVKLPRECQGDDVLLLREPPTQTQEEIRQILEAAATPLDLLDPEEGAHEERFNEEDYLAEQEEPHFGEY